MKKGLMIILFVGLVLCITGCNNNITNQKDTKRSNEKKEEEIEYNLVAEWEFFQIYYCNATYSGGCRTIKSLNEEYKKNKQKFFYDPENRIVVLPTNSGVTKAYYNEEGHLTDNFIKEYYKTGMSPDFRGLDPFYDYENDKKYKSIDKNTISKWNEKLQSEDVEKWYSRYDNILSEYYSPRKKQNFNCDDIEQLLRDNGFSFLSNYSMGFCMFYFNENDDETLFLSSLVNLDVLSDGIMHSQNSAYTREMKILETNKKYMDYLAYDPNVKGEGLRALNFIKDYYTNLLK